MKADEIRALLATCRTELERQWMIEKSATPMEWSTFSKADLLHYVDGPKTHAGGYVTTRNQNDAALIVLTRNFNPARLRVVERLLKWGERCWQSAVDVSEGDETEMLRLFGDNSDIDDAAELLGVTLA